MRVLVTGATGFIGSYLVPELIGAGHHVIGLSRSDAGSHALTKAGAEVDRGDVNDLDRLRALSKGVDGVIHAAFNHDFSNLKQHSEADRRVVETFGEALADSDRPLVITSGTGLVRSSSGAPVTEEDDPAPSADVARAATEEAVSALRAQGVRAMLMRLPQVHDTHHQGRIAIHIQLARRHGWVAYVGDGSNRLPAAHVTDVVRLYRRCLETGHAGARYHAVAEEGVTLRAIAETIGAGMKIEAKSVTPQHAADYFGPLSTLAMADLAASGLETQQTMAWTPVGPDLLSDLRHMDYSAL